MPKRFLREVAYNNLDAQAAAIIYLQMTQSVGQDTHLDPVDVVAEGQVSEGFYAADLPRGARAQVSETLEPY